MNGSGMPFQALLHDLIGLIGTHVTVTAGTHDGTRWPAARVCCAEVSRCSAPTLTASHETLYFPIGDGAGFMVTRSQFTGAAWNDAVLHVELGPVTLMI